VTLELEFATTWLSDVEIYITSPSGVEHVLIQDQAGGADFDGRYTFESQAFRGEDSAGEWTVRIVDDAGIILFSRKNIRTLQVLMGIVQILMERDWVLIRLTPRQ